MMNVLLINPNQFRGSHMETVAELKRRRMWVAGNILGIEIKNRMQRWVARMGIKLHGSRAEVA